MKAFIDEQMNRKPAAVLPHRGVLAMTGERMLL